VTLLASQDAISGLPGGKFTGAKAAFGAPLRHSATRSAAPDIETTMLNCLQPRRFAYPPASMSRKIVQWRATVDEDGHYSFAIAL